MKKIFLFAVLFCINLCVEAQNPKLLKALDAITTSRFTASFDSAANVIEHAGRAVKQNTLYTAEEQQQLEAAYDLSIERFNNLLKTMQNDFLNKQTLKLMTLSPNVYNDSYMLKLKEASNFFDNNFIKLRNEINDRHEIDALGLPAIIAIIEGGLEIIRIVRDFKREMKKMTLSLLDKHFYEPHHIHNWSEL